MNKKIIYNSFVHFLYYMLCSKNLICASENDFQCLDATSERYAFCYRPRNMITTFYYSYNHFMWRICKKPQIKNYFSILSYLQDK